MAIATVRPNFSVANYWVQEICYGLQHGISSGSLIVRFPWHYIPTDASTETLILSVLEASGTDFRITFSAQGSMSIQAAVAAGLGLTVIAEGMVPPELVRVPDD